MLSRTRRKPPVAAVCNRRRTFLAVLCSSVPLGPFLVPIAIVAAVGAIWFAADSQAQPDQAGQSVVLIESESTEEPLPGLIITVVHSGTGFAVEGSIYTCEHVIHGAKKITVTLRTGNKQPAKLIRFDVLTDLAELEIARPPISLRLRTTAPHWFEAVFQIGNPGPIRFAMTAGRFLSFDGVANIFLLDTFFGNSGSPIMDRHGAVIGMTHAIILGTRFTMGGTLQELTNFVHPLTPR